MGGDRGVELQQATVMKGGTAKRDADSEERERAGELRHSITHSSVKRRAL